MIERKIVNDFPCNLNLPLIKVCFVFYLLVQYMFLEEKENNKSIFLIREGFGFL